MTILNFEIINYGFNFDKKSTSKPSGKKNSDEVNIVDSESYFPRLAYLNLNDSLIQIHLQIFEKLKFIFSRFLELRDWYLHNNVGGY